MTTTVLFDRVLRPMLTVLFVCVGYHRIVRSITKSILLPSSLIGKNKQHLDLCMKTAKVPIEERILLNRQIDLVIFNHKSAKGWLVYSNANGVCYEHIVKYTSFLGRFLNRRVCVYNYRSVGYSKGSCNGAADMVDDLKSVIEYLKSKSAEEEEEEDFLLWGHSIGGAVSILCAVQMQKELPNCVVVADRSFRDLQMVVRDKIKQGPQLTPNNTTKLPYHS